MIYDINTTNISFLRTAHILREKYKVRNNLFMLKLYDESLQGVDPYSPNLTDEQKARIFKECCINMWYFIREVSRIPKEGGGAVPFRLSVASAAQLYIIEHNINYLLLLPRQQGKTIGETAFVTWAIMFGTENTTIAYLNKNFAQVKHNLGLFKDQRDALPKWLTDFVRTSEDTDNTEAFRLKSANNDIKLTSSATSKENANRLGRGLTTAIVWADELAFIQHNSIIFAAFVPAWKTASMNAAQNGAPYGIHLTTTPNDIDTDSGKWCYTEIYQKAIRFRESFYDMPEDQLLDYVKNNSDNNYCLIEYTWQELGLSQQWYDEMKKDLLNNTLNIQRELDLKWPLSHENSVFTPEQLEKMQMFVKKPMFFLKVYDKDISFFEKPDFNLNYIIGEDVAGGTGSDRSTIVMLHPMDFHVVATFRNSNMDVDSFIEFNKELINIYFRNAILIIEYNSYGKAVVDALCKDPFISTRLYGEMVENVAEVAIVDGKSVQKKRKVFKYGVGTNKETRPMMYDMLPSIVDNEYANIISEDLFGEIKTLEYSKRHHGKIEAIEGGHDDLVMAYLVARYAIYYGKYMQTYFHINKVPTPTNMSASIEKDEQAAASSFISFMDEMTDLDKTLAVTTPDQRSQLVPNVGQNNAQYDSTDYASMDQETLDFLKNM